MLVNGFENYDVSEDGKVTNIKTGKQLKPDIIWDGYERVSLCKNGETTRYRVHRLVALHFIPNPFNLPVINHIDGVRRNNHKDNLEWSSVKHNRNHGFVPKGEQVVWSRLSEEDVKKACNLISEGLPRGRILKQIPSMSKFQFDDIRRRRSWKHVSCNYQWT